MNAIVMPEAPPTQLDGDALYEIVRGQRVELPVSLYAQWIAGRLTGRLATYAELQKAGCILPEYLFVLDEELDLRRRPDLAFVSVERWPLDRPIPETGDWAVIPDLAIEVISPNDALEAVLGKLQEYFDYGVRQVWLVVPIGRKMYVYDSPVRVRVLSHADTLGETIVPGFTLKVGELFQATR